MRHLSPQYDLTWSDGDERSASDATLRLKNGWRRVFVSTVTEFHEQGRSLTRVACQCLLAAAAQNIKKIAMALTRAPKPATA